MQDFILEGGVAIDFPVPAKFKFPNSNKEIFPAQGKAFHLTLQSPPIFQQRNFPRVCESLILLFICVSG